MNRRLNILVIDDSPAARATLAQILNDAGHAVFQLPSAIGATRLILRNRIRVVIVDLGMPGLSGDRLVSLLRTNPRLSGLIVVVVSGQEPEELGRVRSEAGADAVISKAEAAEQLAGLIAALVAQRAARTS